MSDGRMTKGDRPGSAPVRPVTIWDVSRAAGVSVTTVSQALNGQGRVNPETRERVIRVAAELNYVASPIARALKFGHTMTLVAEMPGTAEEVGLDSAFLQDVLLGAAATAIEAGYVLAIMGPSSARQQLVPPHDGALLIDPERGGPLLESALDPRRPTVTVGAPVEQIPGLSIVDNDYRGGVSIVLRHLAEMGYERPALLTTESPFSFAEDSRAGYEDWCRTAGAKGTTVAVSGHPTIERGREAVRELVRGRRRPDAIVAVTEPLAVGALEAIGEAGLKLPDVGLVSLADSERLRTADVPVTALDLHPDRLGSTAVSLLIDALASARKGGAAAASSVEIETDLIVRAGTARP
jgi:DNA-binding LacI/PurR family transcriptional regulator